MTDRRLIMVADDDPQLRRAVKRAAESKGFDIVLVAAGTDVPSVAIEKRPDLIVLDISFPDADGRDVLARLKADPKTAKIPVLVWSGRDPESDRKIALDLGAEDYVEKTEAKTLLSKVERVLFRLEAM